MNTQAHLIMAAAMFARPNAPRITTAALIGGFAPDFSLYFLFFWSRFVNGNSPEYIFRTQYYSDSWQAVFAVDNSFFVYAGLIALGLMLRREWLWVFATAAFVHLCFDFPLHHDDARQHFWPVTNWVFESPFSYWDRSHYGTLISRVEIIFTLILLVILWRRFVRILPRIIIGLLFIVQLLFLSDGILRWVFTGLFGDF